MGSIFGEDAAKGEIYAHLNQFMGHESAIQLQDVTERAGQLRSTQLARFIGFFVLLITSTGVFVSLQNALNVIWRVKSKPKSGIIKLLINRVLSFSMILTIGFLLLVSLVIHGAIVGLSNLLNDLFSGITVFAIQFLNFTLPLTIITLLFALIFKILPDVRIRWKEIWVGAGFTALLFTLGKYLIGLYVTHVNIGSAYGAAGTVLVLLTWVFYSSIIILFGAEFTKVYAKTFGQEIKPSSYAVRMEMHYLD